MCDYSLQGLPNRLAAVGERLVTHRFTTGSIGLASPADIAARRCQPPKIKDGRSWWAKLKQWLSEPVVPPGPPAVCIAPGTCLLMSRVPENMRRDFALDSVEKVTFIQLSNEPFQYRDAIQFANGGSALLQAFREGVSFEVLEPVPEETEEPRRRLHLVWPADELRAVGRPLARVS